MAKAGDRRILKSQKIEAGQRFGRLTAIEFLGVINRRSRWRFRCDDGNEVEVNAKEVLSEHVRSCGCLRREMVAAKNKANAKHGMSKTPEFNIWCGMKKRCYRKKNKDYHRYGGRDIKVCDEWRDDFAAFFRDMGPRPSPELTIERRDGNGNYCKDNCYWGTQKEQQNNRSNNRIVFYQGGDRTLQEACELAGMNHWTVRARLHSGWTFERAISVPIKTAKKG